jgi:hypothetical protein
MLKGLVLFVLSWFAWLPVAVFAVRGKYPQWLLTPDDPVSPFGQYEETVRKVYARWGRYVGDLYWLGWRNKLFGLSYKWKPDWLKSGTKYDFIRKHISREQYGPLTVYSLHWVEWYYLVQVDLGLFAMLWGHRIDNIYHSEEGRTVRHPNMDGRPTFTFRSRKAMKR